MKDLLNNKYILIGVAILIGGFIGWFAKPSNNQLVESSDHQLIESSNLQYTCSMHPQIRQNEPGDCPICGMELIPLDDDQSNLDPMTVSMSPAAMQLANISTGRVERSTPIKTLRLNGKVVADERLIASQSTHIPGRIEKLMVSFTGEYVKAGQTIAYIYSPDLVTAQEELFETIKIKASQPALYRAAREKLKNWKVTDKQIDQIIRSQTLREEFPILADQSGYVTNKNVNPGDYLQRGNAIYEIADLSSVWVLFDVYESDIPWIRTGENISFTIASLPGEKYTGNISYIDPVIDPKTRVARARIEIRNRSQKLKPEMFASGTLEAAIPSISNALVVPKTAVMWTGKRSVVYVKSVTDGGVGFTMREVTLGPTLGEQIIVEEGLEEGEEIAVNGTFSIDAAAQLAGKPSMMSPGGGPAQTGHNHGGPAISVSSEKSSQPMVKPIEISNNAKEALQPLYRVYLQLKDALVADDMSESQKAATSLHNAITQIDMSLFNGESHEVWMKYSKDVITAIQHIPHYKTIEEVRKVFQPLSNAMIAITRSFNPLEDALFIQHCPMVDNFNGADWLSLSKEIKNPYFGASMLTCGEVTNELN